MQTYTQLCIEASTGYWLVYKHTVSSVEQYLSKPSKGHRFSLAPVTLCLYTQQSLIFVQMYGFNPFIFPPLGSFSSCPVLVTSPLPRRV